MYCVICVKVMNLSSNTCGKIEGMIFMSSDIFEQINIG